MRRIVPLMLAGIVGLAAFASPARAQPSPAALAEADALAGQHPAAYYRRAAAMFASRKDDAVFIFYLGQLRYRVHLAARRSELKPDGDPALFASLSEVVGRPLNEYAFGDIPNVVRIIDAVLAYDEAHFDTFTPPDTFPEAHRGTRAGLERLRAQITADADDIRAKRSKNGLENRK